MMRVEDGCGIPAAKGIRCGGLHRTAGAFSRHAQGGVSRDAPAIHQAGGTVVMTTPRNQSKSRAFYNPMADWMNHGDRELMDVRQMGLYGHENGFDIQQQIHFSLDEM